MIKLVLTPMEFAGYPLTIKRRAYQRTLRLTVKSDGQLLLTAGRSVPFREINRFLESNLSWIARTQNRMNLQRDRRPAPRLEDGGEILVLGVRKSLQIFLTPLILANSKSSQVVESESNLSVYLSATTHLNEVKSLIQQHLFSKARILLQERLKHWAEVTNLRPRNLQLRNQTTRWGSCSSSGTISLNLKLVAFPIEIIDYVVVHELAHLVHHDHSKKFWSLVEHVLPSAPQLKKWLREHSHEADYLK